MNITVNSILLKKRKGGPLCNGFTNWIYIKITKVTLLSQFVICNPLFPLTLTPILLAVRLLRFWRQPYDDNHTREVIKDSAWYTERMKTRPSIAFSDSSCCTKVSLGLEIITAHFKHPTMTSLLSGPHLSGLKTRCWKRSDFQNNDPVICNTTHTICHTAKCQSLEKIALTYSSPGFPREHYSWGNSEQHKIPLPCASWALNF